MGAIPELPAAMMQTRMPPTNKRIHDLRNLMEAMDRKEPQEPAQRVKVRMEQLQDERIRAASDWVSQLSSQQVAASSLDIQLAYSCNGCKLLPAQAASWLLLCNPNSREFWACGQCGAKWGGGGDAQRLLAVNLESMTVVAKNGLN